MRTISRLMYVFLLMIAPMVGQGKRLWVLRSSGELAEYDPATFAAKPTVKLPAGAAQSPQSISVNRLGQILFAPAVSLPLADEDVSSAHKIWFWDGHAAATIDQGVKRETAKTGSNQALTEIAPVPYLAADGGHLFWFANRSRRLQRDDLDLSVDARLIHVDLQEHIADAQGRTLAMGDDDLDLLHVGHHRGMSTAGPRVCRERVRADRVPSPRGLAHATDR